MIAKNQTQLFWAYISLNIVEITQTICLTFSGSENQINILFFALFPLLEIAFLVISQKLCQYEKLSFEKFKDFLQAGLKTVLFGNPIVWMTVSAITNHSRENRLLLVLYCVILIPDWHSSIYYLCTIKGAALIVSLCINQRLSFFSNISELLLLALAVYLLKILKINNIEQSTQTFIDYIKSDETQTTITELNSKNMQTEDMEFQSEVLPSISFDVIVKEPERNVYEDFFRSLQHPAFIVDLNANLRALKLNILNACAKELINSHENILDNAVLEVSNITLNELLLTYRRAVTLLNLKTERIKFPKQKANKNSEKIYDATVATFECVGDKRMAGLILMETPKDREKEKQILDNFKTSLECSLLHELLTPLNSLIPFLRLMPGYIPAGRKEDLRDMALASAELLESKIRDFFDYTKIEQNALKCEETEFVVEELFDEVYKIFQFEIQPKENKLLFKTIAGKNRKLLIFADKMRIKQVLVKLIANANKFTSNGVINVTAAEKNDDLDVIFSVKDSGKGMEKEQLDLIFASLLEKAKMLNEQHEGSTKLPGLGIVIARNICDCMGGKLTATSEIGKGSTFSFEVPICRIFTSPNITHKERPQNSIPDREQSEKIPLFTETNSPSFQEQHYAAPSLFIPDGRERQNLKRRESSGAIKRNKKKGSIRRMRPPDSSIQPLSSSLIIERNKDLNGDIPPEFSVDHSKEREFYQHFASVVRNRSKLLHSSKEIEPITKKSIKAQKMLEEKKERAKVVLVTDDIFANRMVVCQMLKKLNIAVIEAINGEEAVKEIIKSMDDNTSVDIRLVLMDLDMPVMDGVQATREIRKEEKKRGIKEKLPILAVTAHNSEKDREACFDAGMQDFLAKPIRFNTLDAVVRTY